MSGTLFVRKGKWYPIPQRDVEKIKSEGAKFQIIFNENAQPDLPGLEKINGRYNLLVDDPDNNFDPNGCSINLEIKDSSSVKTLLELDPQTEFAGIIFNSSSESEEDLPMLRNGKTFGPTNRSSPKRGRPLDVFTKEFPQGLSKNYAEEKGEDIQVESVRSNHLPFLFLVGLVLLGETLISGLSVPVIGLSIVVSLLTKFL